MHKSLRAIFIGTLLTLPLLASPDWSALERAVVMIKSDQGSGTGVVISVSKQEIRILTAAHVVNDAAEIQIYFSPDRAIAYIARRMDIQKIPLDVAVLEVTGDAAKLSLPVDIPRLETRPLDDADRRADVTSIGYTQRLASSIIAAGTISVLNHDHDERFFEYESHSDMKGFSGGPVFDADGKLIGIHMAGVGADGGMVFALRINVVVDTLVAVQCGASNFRNPWRHGPGSAVYTPVQVSRPFGKLGSSLTFHAPWSLSSESSDDYTWEIELTNSPVHADFEFQDNHFDFETFKASVMKEVGGITDVSEPRVIPIRGQNYKATRISSEKQRDLVYLYDGDFGSLRIKIWGPPAAIDRIVDTEIADLLQGILLINNSR